MKKTVLFSIAISLLISCETEGYVPNISVGEDSKMDQEGEVSQIKLANNYNNEKFNFSLNYPENWEVSEDTLSNLVYILTPSSSADEFQEMINIVIGSSSDLTLEEFFERNNSIVQNSFEELIQLENATVLNINGVDFKTVKYNYTFMGYKLTAKIYVALKGENSYIINCSALQNTFEAYEEDFEKVVNSMTLSSKSL